MTDTTPAPEPMSAYDAIRGEALRALAPWFHPEQLAELCSIIAGSAIVALHDAGYSTALADFIDRDLAGAEDQPEPADAKVLGWPVTDIDVAGTGLAAAPPDASGDARARVGDAIRRSLAADLDDLLAKVDNLFDPRALAAAALDAIDTTADVTLTDRIGR